MYYIPFTKTSILYTIDYYILYTIYSIYIYLNLSLYLIYYILYTTTYIVSWARGRLALLLLPELWDEAFGQGQVQVPARGRLQCASTG